MEETIEDESAIPTISLLEIPTPTATASEPQTPLLPSTLTPFDIFVATSTSRRSSLHPDPKAQHAVEKSMPGRNTPAKLSRGESNFRSRTTVLDTGGDDLVAVTYALHYTGG